jgi:hypothetical protein
MNMNERDRKIDEVAKSLLLSKNKNDEFYDRFRISVSSFKASENSRMIYLPFDYFRFFIVIHYFGRI